MDGLSDIGDARNVDISQIRRQLELSVPERVRCMVDAANTLLTIQQHARRSVEHRTG